MECRDCDPGELLTQSLAVVSPRLREGLDAYEAQRYGDCIEIMAELRTDENRFVAVHAAVYEIKSLTAMERLLEAGQRIRALLADRSAAQSNAADYSYFAPEIAFLDGVCLLADLQYDRAAEVLKRFLDDFPDASQRLTVPAQQMLAELANREEGEIGEVVDLMKFAGRRLSHQDAGETVRDRQQRIIDILGKLIEEARQQESSSNSSSSSGSSQSGSQSQQSPGNPMQQSQLPGGTAQEGPLRERRRVNPGEAWGSMPPAQRDSILQALRDSFPSRYRQLVEQYYEELAKKP